MMKPSAMKQAAVLGLFLSAATSMTFAADWQAKLKSELPAMGHRNWIVVAAAAYPKQSAPGIETVYTGGDQLDVLEKVLKAVEKASHVSAIVLLDAELDSVSEKDAPGVTAYRARLKKLMEGREPKVMLHEDIIKKLDEGSKLFNVLLLKTRLTIPYTSVFLELDCGYWSGEKEKRLRDAIAKGK
jgi:L-fucose mutarotase/ribose pyranase (RbsD/FucU family)